MEHFIDYVKHCYDLVVESEGNNNLTLEHEIEAYVVHLMARNFNRVDIGEVPIAIQILSSFNGGLARERLIVAADECLLINSFPLKKSKWPSERYYQDMGIVAYGLAGHEMERHFEKASKVLHGIFNRNIERFIKIS